MATITVLKPVFSGTLLTFAAASVGGDKFLNNGRTFFLVKNDSVSTITVTVDAQTDSGVTYVDPVTNVGGTTIMVFGPFAPRQFSDTDGYVKLTCSAVTSVSVAAIGM